MAVVLDWGIITVCSPIDKDSPQPACNHVNVQQAKMVTPRPSLLSSVGFAEAGRGIEVELLSGRL